MSPFASLNRHWECLQRLSKYIPCFIRAEESITLQGTPISNAENFDIIFCFASCPVSRVLTLRAHPTPATPTPHPRGDAEIKVPPSPPLRIKNYQRFPLYARRSLYTVAFRAHPTARNRNFLVSVRLDNTVKVDWAIKTNYVYLFHFSVMVTGC